MNKPFKFTSIQALRAVAVILVVLYHLMYIEKKYGLGHSFLSPLSYLGFSGVDLFFVISGFIITHITYGSMGEGKAVSVFLYKRCIRIYPMYWIYSSIVLCVYLINPSLVNNASGNHIDVTSSFLLLPQSQLPLLMVGWSLINEMYFYLFFSLILILPKSYFVKLLSCWGIVTFSCYLLLARLPQNSFIHLIFNPLNLEFLLGCLIALLTKRPTQVSPRLIFCLAISALLITFFISWGTHVAIDKGIFRPLIFGTIYACLIFSTCSFELKQKFQCAGMLVLIGDASYSIYLSHILTINLSGKIRYLLPAFNSYCHLAWLLITVIVTLMVGICSYRYFEKPLTNKLNAWFKQTKLYRRNRGVPLTTIA